MFLSTSFVLVLACRRLARKLSYQCGVCACDVTTFAIRHLRVQENKAKPHVGRATADDCGLCVRISKRKLMVTGTKVAEEENSPIQDGMKKLRLSVNFHVLGQ